MLPRISRRGHVSRHENRAISLSFGHFDFFRFLVASGWQAWSNEASCHFSAVFPFVGSTPAGKPALQEITMEKSQLDLLMEKVEGLERANRLWKFSRSWSKIT